MKNQGADILLDINSPDLGSQIAGLNHYEACSK